MKKTTFKYIQDVYDAMGSATKLAAALDLPAGTVEAWRRSGIPQKHWEKVIKLTGITPAELHFMTERCRKAVTNPSKCR